LDVSLVTPKENFTGTLFGLHYTKMWFV
jgi:hypothetical protein